MKKLFHGTHVAIPHALLWAFALAAVCGCKTTPYRYGGTYHTEHDAGIKQGESQIERGQRRPVLDSVGWIVGVPAKLVMFNGRMSNHDVSIGTELTLQEYLARNGLDKVKVRINQYDPAGEWRRLCENESVNWSLRYTIGTLSVVGYTALPGRVFGGDQYNPYTNTINLYSDLPAVALYEGGHAKDYAQREYKGLYAVVYGIPFVGAFCHNARASNDAIGYIRENGNTQDMKDGYRSICPMRTMENCAPMAALTSAANVLPAIAIGHVEGQVRAVSATATQDGGQAPATEAGKTPGVASPISAHGEERVFDHPPFLQ